MVGGGHSTCATSAGLCVHIQTAETLLTNCSKASPAGRSTARQSKKGSCDNANRPPSSGRSLSCRETTFIPRTVGILPSVFFLRPVSTYPLVGRCPPVGRRDLVARCRPFLFPEWGSPRSSCSTDGGPDPSNRQKRFEKRQITNSRRSVAMWKRAGASAVLPPAYRTVHNTVQQKTAEVYVCVRTSEDTEEACVTAPGTVG